MGMLTLSREDHAVTADSEIVSNRRGIPHQPQIPEVQMSPHAVHLTIKPWTSLWRGVVSPLLSQIKNLRLKANSSQAEVLVLRRPLFLWFCELAKSPVMALER